MANRIWELMLAVEPTGRPSWPGLRSRDQIQAVSGPLLVYGFLTTTPNAVVEPIHPKAMPVILTTNEERDVWMRGKRLAATLLRLT